MLAASGHRARGLAVERDPTVSVPTHLTLRFFRCLTTMVNAGIPVHRSLEHLARSTDAPLNQVLTSVLRQVEEGARFSRALASHPRIFPEMAVGLMEIGERSGQLAACLEALANYMDKNAELRRRIVSALVYPAMLLLLTLFMTAFMLLVIFPRQQQIFQDLGTELPWLTRVLLGILPALSTPLFFGLSGGLLLTVYLGRAHLAWVWKNRLGPWLDRKLLTLPVLGDLLTKAGTAQILHAMTCLLQAGCPLNQTGKAADLAANSELRRRYLDFLEAVSEGVPMGEALSRSGCFPGMAVALFAIADEQGYLDVLASKCARLYDEEVDNSLLTFTALAEPAAIVIMALVMGVVLLATFLPVVSLLEKLA